MWIGRAPTASFAFSAAARLPSALSIYLSCVVLEHALSKCTLESVACRTRFKTAIAAARPFLGLCPLPLLWLKALDALYNFPAALKVVGGKPGARRPDEVRPHD
eukprot:scaffold63854_cov39-Phaeocystis_antarctica.AAC.1